MEDVNKTLDEYFPGWEPAKIEDIDGDKPVTGKYNTRIIDMKRYDGIRNDGETPYDFISLNLEVTEVLEGEQCVGKRLSRTYGCIDNSFTLPNGKVINTIAAKELQRLLDDLFSSNLMSDLPLTKGGFEGLMEVNDSLVDKSVKLTCKAGKKSKKKPLGSQITKIVAEHRLSEEVEDECLL